MAFRLAPKKRPFFKREGRLVGEEEEWEAVGGGYDRKSVRSSLQARLP